MTKNSGAPEINNEDINRLLEASANFISELDKDSLVEFRERVIKIASSMVAQAYYIGKVDGIKEASNVR